MIENLAPRAHIGNNETLSSRIHNVLWLFGVGVFYHVYNVFLMTSGLVFMNTNHEKYPWTVSLLPLGTYGSIKRAKALKDEVLSGQRTPTAADIGHIATSQQGWFSVLEVLANACLTWGYWIDWSDVWDCRVSEAEVANRDKDFVMRGLLEGTIMPSQLALHTMRSRIEQSLSPAISKQSPYADTTVTRIRDLYHALELMTHYILLLGKMNLPLYQAQSGKEGNQGDRIMFCYNAESRLVTSDALLFDSSHDAWRYSPWIVEPTCWHTLAGIGRWADMDENSRRWYSEIRVGTKGEYSKWGSGDWTDVDAFEELHRVLTWQCLGAESDTGKYDRFVEDLGTRVNWHDVARSDKVVEELGFGDRLRARRLILHSVLVNGTKATCDMLTLSDDGGEEE